jgi:Zn-dependent M28 family amino/carboxypeptidase
VASVLEIDRALRAGPRLRNDVVFVFSDGQDNGDLGAAAFAGQSQLMRGTEAMFNWDIPGSHGPAYALGNNSSRLSSSAPSTRRRTPGLRAASVAVPRRGKGRGAQPAHVGVRGTSDD